MKVVIATVQVPFIRGGAELLAEGLRDAIALAGHEVEIVSAPFRFSPATSLRESVEYWLRERMDAFDAGRVDRVIFLKFPAYYADASDASLWLLHQHRGFYELWGGEYGGIDSGDAEVVALRAQVMELDSEKLAAIPRRYTIGRRVSERLAHYNGVDSEPLYHPPAGAGEFYCGGSEPYVFFPSRLESIKRQDLLIDAMAMVRSPLVALIAGEGGQGPALATRVETLGLGHKVRMLGRITPEQMLSYYANCRAVFFGPHDEDYGYITLEAMLSSKPVVTCTDSGGPLEFVVAGETGEVVAPEPEEIAAVLDRYAASPATARRVGAAGLARYRELGIGWATVVERLLA